MRVIVFLTIGMAVTGCGTGGEVEGEQQSAAIGTGAEPSPTVTFTQNASTVGLARNNEPPSAGTFTSANTLAYGSWLADIDGDGRVDYFGVNHGQTPHLSGLWMNNGTGGFGK